jgi:hypothetical protein
MKVKNNGNKLKSLFQKKSLKFSATRSQLQKLRYSQTASILEPKSRLQPSDSCLKLRTKIGNWLLPLVGCGSLGSPAPRLQAIARPASSSSFLQNSVPDPDQEDL